MDTILLMLITLWFGAFVFGVLIPHDNREFFYRELRRFTSLSQAGGYVHDTHMTQFIPPNMCHYVTGTWSDAAGSVANTFCKSKAQANETATITVPITLPQNSSASKGSYLKSIDIWWECLTLAMDAVSAAIYKATLPATGADFGAPAAVTFSYDSGHDDAAERITLDEHKMTLTLDTPIWLDEDDLVTVQLSMNAGATSDLTFFGARANYTARL